MKADITRDRDYVRASIDDCLSGVDQLPSLRADIMRKARGEVKVKKKLSIGLAIALVLMLVAAVAVASVVLREYYEKAFETQNEEGYYQQWPLDDKIELIDRMATENFAIDRDQVAMLHDDNLSLDEKTSLADSIVSAYYGEGHDGSLSVVDMMEKDMGQMADWSLEDKAWVSEQEQHADTANSEEIHKLPQDGDITQEQAVTLAKKILCEQYDVSEEEVETYHITIDFMQLTDDTSAATSNENVYQVAFYTPFSKVHPYFVLLTADGNLRYSSRPFGMDRDINDVFSKATEHFSTPQEKAQFSKEWSATIREAVRNGEDVWDYYQYLSTIDYIAPDERFITQETAQARAEASIYSVLGWKQELLACYDPFVSLRRTKTGDASHEQVIWYFKYVVDSQNIESYWDQKIPWGVNVVVDARTGEMILVDESTNNERYCQFNE